MEPQVYQEIAAIEDWHWWFTNTRKTLLDRLLEGVPAGARVFDAGCGSGAILCDLRARGLPDAIGADSSSLALLHAAPKNPGRVMAADLTALPFGAAGFDAITCADVLEHVKADEAALGEFHRVLRPGGRLGLVVPAFQVLWTEHDDANHHQRRYTLRQLTARVERAGFAIDHASYINMTLGIPIACYRLYRRAVESLSPRPPGTPPDSDIKPLPGLINGAAAWLFGLENRTFARHRLPFGTSALVIAHRPAAS